MKLVIDIECNGLNNPTKIWLICTKDIDTGEVKVFRNPTDDQEVRNDCLAHLANASLLVGHNIIGYDYPVLVNLLNFSVADVGTNILDTLILSKLIDYPREKHSVEDYGVEFGLPKGKNHYIEFFTKWSLELEQYCIRDVEITYKIYLKYLKYLSNPLHTQSIVLEHNFSYYVCNVLHRNGFSFNVSKAQALLTEVTLTLDRLDKDLLTEFPPKEVLIREFIPKATKFGTINKTSVPRALHSFLHTFEIGVPFKHTRMEAFNPASHKQVIEVLNAAGWSPVVKTKTHIDTEREVNKLKYKKHKSNEVDARLKDCYNSLLKLEKFGWKINEANLATLPPGAPPSARTLAKRIIYESRRRTLTEWLGLVDRQTSRIHGRFQGIGAWTHRMAHQEPNMANIPNEFFISTGARRLLGRELRELWQAPRKRLLVGVDAEAIQFRIFAHLINDKELIDAIVNGKKADKTDPHSYNQKIFGTPCKTRNASKHSMFAIFFGGRANKISQIMACSKSEAEEAIERLLSRYPGLSKLENEVFPVDARKGYFVGLDGRKVRIDGDTESKRKHLCMSGYLQNGEAVIMKMATLKFINQLEEYDSLLVDLVHDEWQTETPNDMAIALKVAKLQSDALKSVGEELGLNCPMAGSFYDDTHNDYTIGLNWAVTH